MSPFLNYQFQLNLYFKELIIKCYLVFHMMKAVIPLTCMGLNVIFPVPPTVKTRRAISKMETALGVHQGG